MIIVIHFFLSLLLLVDRVRALISWTVQGRWKLRLNDACSLFLSLSHKRILLGLDKDNAQSSKALCVPVRKPFFFISNAVETENRKKNKTKQKMGETFTSLLSLLYRSANHFDNNAIKR